MHKIESIEALEALYDQPKSRSLDKVQSQISPLYKRWIEAARFVILSTTGPEGTDASPRGDDGAVVRVKNPKTILLPDWRGNNRLDSLRNIVRDPKVSLLFMIHGESIVVRVNGQAFLTDDEAVCGSFEKEGKHPKLVVVIEVEEAYFQCAKSIIRSKLWQPSDQNVPSAGDLLHEKIPEIDAREFDESYPDYAKTILWG